jgi:hypothetical protein
VGFQSTNQQCVFEHCAKASIDEFLNGYNATIIAFGQVGSGKTYTIAGDRKVTHLELNILYPKMCRAGCVVAVLICLVQVTKDLGFVQIHWGLKVMRIMILCVK